MPTVRAVDPLRQACTGCGGSCQGVRVRVLPDEEPAIRRAAEALSVPEPVVDGRLRMVDGRCAFLDGARCAIHGRFGAAAKPAICRQYPLVLVDADGELRAGVDPGCYAAAGTREAPTLSLEGAHANRVPLDPSAARHEAGLLAVLGRPGMTVGGALSAIVGEPAEGVPPAFAARWRALVRKADLGRLIARPDAGDAIRDALAPVLAGLDGEGALGATDEAWAVEATRRLVALRLLAGIPFLPAAAVLSLGGAVAIGWAGVPDPPRAIAAWSRALRAPPFWSALLPGPEALGELFGR